MDVTSSIGITRLVPSHNTLNTSHYMHIIRLKRVYLEIPGIGECRHNTVLEMSCGWMSLVQ
jgi:hypothetical protein